MPGAMPVTRAVLSPVDSTMATDSSSLRQVTAWEAVEGMTAALRAWVWSEAVSR